MLHAGQCNAFGDYEFGCHNRLAPHNAGQGGILYLNGYSQSPCMIRRAAIAILPSVIMIAGCAGQPSSPARHPSLPATSPASTIIVPTTQNPLANAIRQTLSTNGWQITGNQSAGTSNTPADARSMARQARYRLTLTASPSGDCRSGEPSFMYRLSVIENASGKVPLAMSGADCLGAISQQFQQELTEDGLAPEARPSPSQSPATQ